MPRRWIAAALTTKSTKSALCALCAISVAAAATAACKERALPLPASPPHVDEIEVATDDMRVLTGSVGEGKFQSEATYVLVDVRNTGPRDLLVTLRGHLVDDSKNRLGALGTQSLRVPRAGMRMFALVDAELSARPAATAAEIEVTGAMAPGYAPPVEITEGRVDMDFDKAVVQGYVVNTAERRVRVIVIAGFYDADKKPVKRRSTKLTIDGGEKRGVMLAGPPGSKSGYMFVGEYAY